MKSEQPKNTKDMFENGFKNISSFLRSRALPGRLLVSRKGEEGTTGFDTIPSPQATPASSHAADTLAALELDSSNQTKQSDSLHINGGNTSMRRRSASSSTQPPGSNGSKTDNTTPHDRMSGETSTSGQPPQPPAAAPAVPATSQSRLNKFHKLLNVQVVDLDALHEVAWSGIPPDLRPLCWKLLLGYLPLNRDKRTQILARKRREYLDLVPDYYDIENSQRDAEELGVLKQVAVDVERTLPATASFFQQPAMQASLKRILYIWGVRHPASGYVQGMNDLVTPFLAVFLSEHFTGAMATWEVDTLPEKVVLEVEADAYWCLCKLLDGIQDHYTYAQPGIQRTVIRLQDLVKRLNERVARHIEQQGIEFLQFSFRWVNCLLLREVPFPLAMRLWDTYLAESVNLNDFLVYVCASFLLVWEEQLLSMDFQDIVMFLQKPPTSEWSDKEVEMLLSNAYVWRASFNEAQSHLDRSD